MNKKIMILGPAHPLRGGGMTTFNHRLTRAFLDAGHSVEICSFSLQYPSFLFPGKTQFTDEPAPEGLIIHTRVNSVNPLNWLSVGNWIARQKPDILVVRYWLPFMGPALGTIARRVKKNRHTKVICIADNVIPHEKRPGDKAFTRYFLRACDGFVTMSDQVSRDLQQFNTTKPRIQLRHPLYDNFGEALPEKEARSNLGINPSDKLILFFGFIRSYKGLDLLLEAMALLKDIPDLKLLIAGEFYGDEEKYQKLIDEKGIRDRLYLHTRFIADQEVRNYFCAADLVVQPYRHATQSGVTPLAFNYERPTLVTKVGGLPDLIDSEKTGLVAEPDPESLARGIRQFYQLGRNHFIPFLKAEKEKYSWPNFVRELMALESRI